MAAYYNEIDPYAAQWLRNLIAAGHIADGEVDERSIEDVRPSDLKGFTQCHFFAGIGVWSYALRQAGWADDEPAWSGSCPCFPAGTLILTQRGHLPIEDVVVGDLVLTHRARWRPVTHVGSESSELVMVRGQGHPGLICTPDHPFLTGTEEWTAAKDLRGRRWRTVAYVPEDASALPWTETGRGVLLDRGRWRASGWKDGKTVYLGRFSTRDEAVAARVAAVSEGRIDVRGADAADPWSLGFARFLGYWVGDGWATKGRGVALCGGHNDSELLAEIMTGAGLAFTASIERTGTRVRCGSINLAEWLHTQFGATAVGKRIPAWMHAMPEDYRRKFLQGYWEADGHAEPKALRWTTVSRALALGVRILLNQQGMGVSITHFKPARNTTIEGRTVNQREIYNATAYNKSRSFSFDEHHGIGFVRAVEPAGHGRVYNIAVTEDESYCADGIVVHNCQPFSAAGTRAGFADERHLWPAFYHLIQQCKPAVVFGEQIASKDAEAWVDLVQVDLEAVGYSFGTIPFPAASVGAPHIRDRLYWVGDSISKGLEGLAGDGELQERKEPSRPTATSGFQLEPGKPGPTNGFWAEADWLRGQDGLWRAVEPGTSPLADGTPSRVGRLRSYGNAINAEAAKAFIESYLET